MGLALEPVVVIGLVGLMTAAVARFMFSMQAMRDEQRYRLMEYELLSFEPVVPRHHCNTPLWFGASDEIWHEMICEEK